MGKTMVLLLVFACCCNGVRAQDTIPVRHQWIDSIRVLLADPARKAALAKIHPDSAVAGRLEKIIASDTAKLLHLPRPETRVNFRGPARPALQLTGGSISYDWNYRSNIDTPFQEHGVAQNLVSAHLDLVLASAYPFTVSYFERESNSQYFRSYRDVRVAFNSAEFNQMQARRLTDYLDQLAARLRDPALRPALDITNGQLSQMDDWLHRGAVVTQLTHARATVLNGTPPDSVKGNKDSVLQSARAFLASYDLLEKSEARLKGFRDSLQKEYIANERKLTAIRKISNSNLPAEAKKEALQAILPAYGAEKERLQKIYGKLSGIRMFALGKVLPNYSDLTLRNINVNGVSFEYSRGIYLAFTAGAVDYRARDFFYARQKMKPQLMYAARAGYGSKEGTHAFFTAFKGKKQLLNSAVNTAALDIYGLSFEAQVLLNKHIRLLGEIAQSAAPALVSAQGSNEKPAFPLNDQKNKAYSLALYSSFPKTGSRLEGYYRYRGIDYQNFSSFYSNAATTSWQLRGDQYFWKKMIHLNASIAKNNYENAYLPVRYTGSTVTKNIGIGFRKNKWPTLTVSLMPSSQLSEINGQVYDNYYQAFNLSSSHVYRLGLARAVTVVSYNRFYNDSRDSGFIYYNARNIYITQSLQFLSYSANINISRSVSRDYTLTILDAGASAKVFRISSVGFGVKINQLNGRDLKLGLYGSEQIILPRVGELRAWIEKAYLPGWNSALKKNEFYNLSFTRFFK